MPIYEYSCRKCGDTIEILQKMSDPDVKKHEGCGGGLTRLFSVPGFQFKSSEPTGLPDKNPYAQQQLENDIKRKEKKKAPRIVNAPTSGKSAKKTKA